MTTITETREALPTGTWAVDPVHSHVGFGVAYMGGTFRGTFSPVDARLEVAGDGTATLTGGARVDSIRVQDENLQTHLLSPDFFDAERTPELRFVSTEVRREGGEVAIAGELELKGRRQPVELRGTLGEPGPDAFGKERFPAILSGTIDRTQFGLDWNMPLPSGEPALANDVQLTAELFLVRA